MATHLQNRSAWNKGFTKATHPSVKKISLTMRRRKLDNFIAWRNRMKALGSIKSSYASFTKNGDLAELIGVILGDGHIEKHPRTEKLTIACDARKKGFIKRYVNLIGKVIGKAPAIYRQSGNSLKIYLYEKHLSRRLGIIAGSRRNIVWQTPPWIWQSKRYLIRYLRGLYEAEGNFAVHRPTYTYKLFFVNRNKSLLRSVFNGLPKIGVLSAHLEKYRVTVSRKADVFKLKKLISFRDY